MDFKEASQPWNERDATDYDSINDDVNFPIVASFFEGRRQSRTLQYSVEDRISYDCQGWVVKYHQYGGFQSNGSSLAKQLIIYIVQPPAHKGLWGGGVGNHTYNLEGVFAAR